MCSSRESDEHGRVKKPLHILRISLESAASMTSSRGRFAVSKHMTQLPRVDVDVSNVPRTKSSNPAVKKLRYAMGIREHVLSCCSAGEVDRWP